MQILPDGNIQIRNKQTGEAKTIKPEELGNYGIPYSVYDEARAAHQQQQDAIENLKMGVGDINKLNTDNPSLARQAIVAGIQVPPPKEDPNVKAKKDAERIIGQLEDLYTNGGKPLSYGRFGGLPAEISNMVGSNVPVRTYEAAVKSNRPTLARAAGNSGNLSEPEQQAAIALLPSTFSTPEEAAAGFAALRAKMGLSQRELKGLVKKSKPKYNIETID